MNLENERKFILAQLETLRDMGQHAQVSRPEVSAWPVGMHLEHLALAGKRMSEFVCQADSDQHRRESSLSWLGRIVLFIGRIPRGRGKAPELVEPKDFEQQRFLSDLDEIKENLESADLSKLLKSECAYPHKYFGNLSPAQWLRLQHIHQDHHLRIIRDILALSEAASPNGQ